MTIYWLFQIIDQTLAAPKLFPSLQDREYYITNTPMDSYRVFQYDIEEQFWDLDSRAVSNPIYSLIGSDNEDLTPWLQSRHDTKEDAIEAMIHQVKKDCCLLWVIENVDIEDDEDIRNSYRLANPVDEIPWVQINEDSAVIESDCWRTIGYIIHSI